MTKNTSKKLEDPERAHFDKYAESYDENYGYSNEFTKYKINKKVAKLILNLPRGRTKLKVLELGCGTGEYTKKVAQILKNSTIYAIDISPKIVSLAKVKNKNIGNVRFIVKSAYSTGYKSKTFDLIFGFYVLHHLDLELVGKEVTRLLKPGGVAFFYEPNIFNPIVYIIKRTPAIKILVGDSPDEQAINPVTVARNFGNLKVKMEFSEFIYPFSFLNPNFLIGLDKITSQLQHIPLIKYLGGSVSIRLSNDTG